MLRRSKPSAIHPLLGWLGFKKYIYVYIYIIKPACLFLFSLPNFLFPPHFSLPQIHFPPPSPHQAAPATTKKCSRRHLVPPYTTKQCRCPTSGRSLSTSTEENTRSFLLICFFLSPFFRLIEFCTMIVGLDLWVSFWEMCSTLCSRYV
jgi:hypothetical protein